MDTYHWLVTQANPELFPEPDKYTYDEWLWATFTFQTRGYGWRSLDLCTFSRCVAWLRSLVDPRYRDQLSHVLIPLFDMMDHSTVVSLDDKTRYVWNVENDTSPLAFTVFLNREVHKGAHVRSLCLLHRSVYPTLTVLGDQPWQPFISYGKLSNLELLNFYGFVVADNAAEYVNLGIPYQFREDVSAETKQHIRGLIQELNLK